MFALGYVTVFLLGAAFGFFFAVDMIVGDTETN
jgi:hypothetical protein